MEAKLKPLQNHRAFRYLERGVDCEGVSVGCQMKH